MAKTAWIFSYKLKKNVSEEEFVEATKNLHDEFISKAKGFITRKLLKIATIGKRQNPVMG